jgi:hypothetical protein
VGLDTYAARIPIDFFAPGLDESSVDEHFGCTWRDRWAFRRAEKRRERKGGCIFGGIYFRGKLYSDLVKFVTGVYIYQTWIPPETVKKMSEAFDRCDPEATIEAFRESDHVIYDHSPSEVADLRAFFKVCAKRGLGLVGSW